MGKIACDSVSTKDVDPCGGPTTATTFPGININAENYFTTDHLVVTLSESLVTLTKSHLELNSPFVYQPAIKTDIGLSGAVIIIRRELINPGRGQDFPDYGLEDYGYIPQALVNLLNLSPNSFQKLSLRPGGPKIGYRVCETDLPVDSALPIPVSDLTDSSTQTIEYAGCFHPGACPEATTPAAATTSLGKSASQPTPAPAQRADSTTMAAETLAVSKQAAATSRADAPQNQIAQSGTRVPIAAPVITIDSSVPTANSATNFVIDSQALASGSSSVIMSETASALASSTAALVMDGNTSPLESPQSATRVEGNIIQAFNDLKTAQAEQSGLTPARVITIGSQSITANSVSQFVVQGQTLAAGGAPITVAGSTFSLASLGSALVIKGVKIALPALSGASPSPSPIITIANQFFTANSASQFVVQNQTLAAGGTPITVAGTTFSLDPSGTALIVNGVTSALPSLFEVTQSSAPIITIGTQAVTANPASQFVIHSQTLAAGGTPVTVSGTTYSLATSGTALVVNGITIALSDSFGALSSPEPTIIIGNQAFTANSHSEFTIGGQILRPGDSPITVSGTTYSLAPHATAIIIDNKTTFLQPSAGFRSVAATTTASTNPVLAKPELIVGDQTAIAGGPVITVSGIRVSLLPSGTQVLIGTSTEAVPPGGPTPVILTIGSQTVTATKAFEYILGSQTVTPGGAVTVSGVLVSLAPDGNDVVVQGSTIDLSSPRGTSSPAGFTGHAGKVFGPRLKEIIGSWGLGILMLALL